MDILCVYIIKFNVYIRKKLLNLLLLLFSPRKKFMISLSQNLDKYIVLYQKLLFKEHNKKNTISSPRTSLVL